MGRFLDPASLPVGTVVGGDFRIERWLGGGGMGIVYATTQLSTSLPRALKILRPELVGDEREMRRFVDEARLGARIPSDHVVAVVGSGVDAAINAPWIAMELLEGEDLSAAIARAGALPLDECRVVLEQLCHGVGKAHEAGIVHRDLKPENIFLARSRTVGATVSVKVLDFGIAKSIGDRLTRMSALPGGLPRGFTEGIGTPMWMAPEQTNYGVVTPATDVWAIGLIAYKMLTGRYYWRSAQSSAASAVLEEMLTAPIDYASVRAKEQKVDFRLPAGFDAWFYRAVHPDPKQRFPDAANAWQALAPILQAARRGFPAWSRYAFLALVLVGSMAVAGLVVRALVRAPPKSTTSSSTSAPTSQAPSESAPVSGGCVLPTEHDEEEYRLLAKDLASIASAARDVYARGLQKSGPPVHFLCDSAAPIPDHVPTGDYIPETNDGKDFASGTRTAGWACLGISLSHPLRFQIGYSVGSGYRGPAAGLDDPGPGGFEVWAVGDLDRDGQKSLFTIAGVLDERADEIRLRPLRCVNASE
ncbi:MAG: serine/threonine-protein kinase [Polyangiaceae bacterium]